MSFKIARLVGVVLCLWTARAFADDEPLRNCFSKLIIAPPHTSDSLRADALADSIQAALAQRSSLVCDASNVIPQDLSRPIFDKFGITSHFAVQPDRIYPEQIEYLSQELGATHFVSVALNKKNDVVHVEVRKIQEDYSLAKPLLKFDLPYAATVSPLESSNKWVRLLAPLSANSVTVGTVDTHLEISLENGYGKVADHTRGVLPPLISSISFSKIEHYRAFKEFDYSGSIFPSTFFFGIDQDTDVEKLDKSLTDPTRYSTLHVEAYGGCTTVLAEGSLHSPIGTTYGGVGFGPCIVQKRQERREPVVYGTTAFRVEFGHRAFMNESWFFYFNIDAVNFSGTSIYQSDVGKTNSVTRSGVGIGYFIADTEHLFSTFWR